MLKTGIYTLNKSELVHRSKSNNKTQIYKVGVRERELRQSGYGVLVNFGVFAIGAYIINETGRIAK